MDESGFTYGLVVRNSMVQHYAVMIVRPGERYVYNGKPMNGWFATALVVQDGSRHSNRVGQIVQISGKVGTKYGDWWVVE